MSGLIKPVTDLSATVAHVRQRIAAATDRTGRLPDDVRLVAVTKGFAVEAVHSAIAAGIGDIGENRVQEAAAKIAEVGHTVHWHLLGHLQSNKANRAAQLFDAVHSIDSHETAVALAEHRPYEAPPVGVLVQVDYTGAPARSGIAEGEALALVRGLVGMGGIHVMGLMTVAAPGDADVARDTFRRLRLLRDSIEATIGWELTDLSMGMSDDYEIAVEEGATIIRLGRALFGER